MDEENFIFGVKSAIIKLVTSGEMTTLRGAKRFVKKGTKRDERTVSKKITIYEPLTVSL
jgi:hypothetical protein